MKVLKRLFTLSVIGLFTLSCVTAGNLDGVVINTYSDHVTAEQHKYRISNYLINLVGTGTDIIAKHRMINAAGNNMSDWRWTRGGEVESLPNKAGTGKYRLKINRSGAFPRSETLYGNWSPNN